MTFILPGTKHETTPLGQRADAAYEEARASRARRREADKRLSFAKAVKQLSLWTTSTAVEALSAMPQGIQQMYLLAEEGNLNRSEVQRFFPAVAPSTREAWVEYATPPAAEKRATPNKRKA